MFEDVRANRAPKAAVLQLGVRKITPKNRREVWSS